MYPCQNITVRMLQLSDVVMVLSWHEGEGFTLWLLWSRFGLWLEFRLGFGLGLGWVFGSNGTDDGLLPLVICNLERGIVLVRPCIEPLDLSVLQLALEYERISGNAWEMLQDIAYYLYVVVVCRPKPSNCLSIISECVVLVCCQIQFLWLWTSGCLPFACMTVFLCRMCHCASSTSCHFLLKFPGIKIFAYFTTEALHCTGKGLCRSRKQINRRFSMNSVVSLACAMLQVQIEHPTHFRCAMALWGGDPWWQE